MFNKKVAAVSLMAFSIIAVQAAAPLSVQAAQAVSLSDAIVRGVQVSPDLAALRKQLMQKNMGVVEAQKSILNQAEKDASSYGKQHSLSRDIELSTKVPAAQLDVRATQKDIETQTRLTQMQVETAYMTAYQSQISADNAQKAVDKAQKSLDQLRTKQTFGYATQDDVKTAEKALEDSQSAYKSALLAFKSARLALGEMIGRDLDGSDVRFDLPRRYAILDEKTMWGLTSAALRNDADVYKDTESRRLAEAKVNTITQLYRSKFGAEDFAILESSLQSSTGETDYDTFMVKYNELAEKIDARWQGYTWILTISFPFLKHVPLKDIQGEYEGLRYFEDKQNALPLAMLDAEKARLKEKDTRTKVMNEVQKSYLTAKQSEESYAQSMKARDLVKQQVAEAENKQRFGLLTAEQVDEVRAELSAAEQAVLTAYMAYKTSLSQLNFDSSGGLNDQTGILPYDKVTNGYEPFTPQPAEADTRIGTWLLEPVVAGMTSQFSIKLDDKLGATHYQLRSKSAGKPVGELTPANQKVVHLNLVFSDISDLELVAYKDKTEIGTAALDGYSPSGTLTRVK